MSQKDWEADPEHPRWLMPLVVAGFLVSGMAGLVDEVVWSRTLSLLIGGTTAAQTIVLATFMGGLALGNWVFGRHVDRSADALRLYAMLELGVGIVCVSFPEIFAFTSRLYIWMATPLGFAHPATVPLKLCLAASTVLIPTFLMGGTLPALARVVVRDISGVTVSIARLYTVNSLGAVAGVAVGGFLLVPSLGLHWTIRLSGMSNLLLAAVFFIASRKLHRRRAGHRAARPEGIGSGLQDVSPVRCYTPKQQRVALLAIGIAGAVSMIYEVVWTRLLTLVMGSSTFSFTIMLLTFISGITLGAWTVGRLVSDRRDAVLCFAVAEIGVFVSIVPLIPVYDRLPLLFSVISAHLDHRATMFSVYLAMKVAIAFALMLMPTFFIGMTLPLASRIAVDRMAVLGRRVGSVFSVNTLGTVIGATLTGLVLIPVFQLRTTLEIGVALSAGLGILLLSVSPLAPRLRTVVGLAVASTLAVVMTVTPAWDQLALHFGLYRHTQIKATSTEKIKSMLSRYRLEYAHHGVDTSVSVIRDLQTGKLYQKCNGKTEAGTGADMATQLWLGHLGMLLKPEARRVAVVGLGSGITVGAALTHPGAEADVMEISRSVVESADWFAPFNGDVLDDPRMRLHLGDAKEFFNLRSDDRWDVIVSQPSNPWMAGVGNLFSVETFEQLKGNLGEQGLLVQWMQLYELDDELLRVTLNTLGAVFDHVEVWQCNQSDIILIASAAPIVTDVAAIGQRLREPRVRKSLNHPHIQGTVLDASSLLLHQVLSAERYRALFPGDGPLNSDSKPLLEYRAPRAFFVGARADLMQHWDERLVSAEINHTHLATALAGSAPSAGQMTTFVRELEARRGPANAALLRSLAWMYRWTDPEHSAGRRLFEQYGDEELWEHLNSEGIAAAEKVRAQARALTLATSMFHLPETGSFIDEIDRLRSISAPSMNDPATVADIWYALYTVGDLEQIEDWPRPVPDGMVDDPTGWLGRQMSLAELQDLLVAVGRALGSASNDTHGMGVFGRAEPMPVPVPVPVPENHYTHRP